MNKCVHHARTNPKVYGDLALLGDRAQSYSQWYHPNSAYHLE